MTIADLILDALDKGYDVTVSVRSRTDGKSGALIVPKNWRDILNAVEALADYNENGGVTLDEIRADIDERH